MIYFYNPHVDDFLAEPPHFQFLKRRALKKYGHWLQNELKNHGKVNVVVDSTSSAFVPMRIFSKLPRFLRQIVTFFEIRLWIKANQLEGRVHKAWPGSDDVVIAFSYKNAVGDHLQERLNSLSNARAVYYHLSHYFVLTKQKSQFLMQFSQKYARLYLSGDSDITSNPYFQTFFSWYKNKFVILPFSVADRFKKIKPFQDRLPKAVATGTFHNLDLEDGAYRYQDYQNFFKTNNYHPVRKMIYDSNLEQAGYVDVFISLFKDYTSKGVQISQKKYFSFDIVEKYNSYQYAVIGEEAVGFPALGAFEAMACGTVLLAQPDFYRGLGLEPDVHYVSYDGTEEDLKRRIDDLRKDPDKAERITQNALAIVEKFRSSQQSLEQKLSL